MTRRYGPDEVETRPARRLMVELLGPLFAEPPAVPVNTSQEAAQEIKPSAAAIRERVYAHIKECGTRGATEQEIETATALAGNTVRPRLRELERAGRIVKSPATRPTRSGRAARVYVVRA